MTLRRRRSTRGNGASKNDDWLIPTNSYDDLCKELRSAWSTSVKNEVAKNSEYAPNFRDYSRHWQTKWVKEEDKSCKGLAKLVNNGKPLQYETNWKKHQDYKFREVIARDKKELERQAKEARERKIRSGKKIEFDQKPPSKYDGKPTKTKTSNEMAQKATSKPAPKILKTEKWPKEPKGAFFGNVPRNAINIRTYYKHAADVPFVPLMSAKKPPPKVSSSRARSMQVSPSTHLLQSRPHKSSCSACAEKSESARPKKTTIPTMPKITAGRYPRMKSSPPLESYYLNLKPPIPPYMLKYVLPQDSSKLLKVSDNEAYMSLCPPFIAQKFNEMRKIENGSTSTSNTTFVSFGGSSTCCNMGSNTSTIESGTSITNSGSSATDSETTTEKNLADDEGPCKKKNVLYPVAPQSESFAYLDMSDVPMKVTKTVQGSNDQMILTLTLSTREEPEKIKSAGKKKKTAILDCSADNGFSSGSTSLNSL